MPHLKIVDHSYKQSNIELEIENTLSNEKLFGSKRELVQVLINILNNAKDALLDKKVESPKVQIKLSKNEKGIIITISDNAGGIPRDILSKIFDPYFTTKHESVGNGIGLSMSHKIINDHFNGLLHVSNDKEGACFTIEIPKK